MGEYPGPQVAAARRRWRAAGDRIWPVAMSDGAAYRQTVEAVGQLVDALRAETGTLAELVALEAEPSAFLGRTGEAGRRALGQAELLAAACAVRADELAASGERVRRSLWIADARAAGRAWVVLDESPTRTVEMHVRTGRAIVATADPYLGGDPFRLGETVLDAVTGEPLAAPAGDGATYATHADWTAAWSDLRAEIGTRLDSSNGAGSDR